MGLGEAMLCMALVLSIGNPGETPYVHVVSQTDLEKGFCGPDCAGTYIPLRSRFNGGRFSIVLSEDSRSDVFMTELAEFVRHANNLPRYEPAQLDNGALPATDWRQVCPQIEGELDDMIAGGGTPLPEHLQSARAWNYAGDKGANELRDEILRQELLSEKEEDRPQLAKDFSVLY